MSWPAGDRQTPNEIYRSGNRLFTHPLTTRKNKKQELLDFSDGIATL
jgi:hypothetical protein